MQDISPIEEDRLFAQYRSMWKQVIRDAPGCGSAKRVHAKGTLKKRHLEDALSWVRHKAGGVGEHTLVIHPLVHDRLQDIAGQGYYWTGDAGRFDTGDVFSLDGFSPIRVRIDRGIYPEAAAIVELDHVSLTGDVPTFTRDLDGNTTAHPYAVITDLPTRDAYDYDQDDDGQVDVSGVDR